MKSFWRWCLIAFLISSSTVNASPPHIAVGQIVEHSALDKLRKGLKDGLSEQGYVEGKNLKWTYENAQGNPTTAVQIGHKLVSLDPNVIVTLSTPMTQAVATATTKIPIVFGAVSDPKAAKLTSHKNVTGLTDIVPAEQQLELIKRVLPHVKTIGLIYNSGEANSQKQAHELKAHAAKHHIHIVEATVSKSSEVAAATKTLVGKVDAILLPTDNTVITALESIVKICDHNNIPIFGSDVDIVQRGAFAAYGVDWYQSGHILATIVRQLLEGKSIKSLPIQNPNKLLFYINKSAAQRMGIPVNEDLLEKADLVI